MDMVRQQRLKNLKDSNKFNHIDTDLFYASTVINNRDLNIDPVLKEYLDGNKIMYYIDNNYKNNLLTILINYYKLVLYRIKDGYYLVYLRDNLIRKENVHHFKLDQCSEVEYLLEFLI